MKTTSRWLSVLVGFFSLAAVAQAHPGHDGHELTWDFGAGFAHPFTGWDHLLAMIAVGWWAAQLGGRARFYVPAAFNGLMTIGAILGRFGGAVPGVEQAIAASILVFGLLIARSARLPVAMAVVITGAFAVFHGLAHGAEARMVGAGGSALVGFALATAVLHAVGLTIGMAANRTSARAAAIGGSAIAMCGLVLLVA